MAAQEGGADGAGTMVREQDKFLPIANISRIMKEALPHNAKVSKDAKELVQQCVSDFIIYITSQASDKCQREKRKTVNGDDILWAMSSLGFDDAVIVLTTYLKKAEGEEKSAKGGPPKEGAASAPSGAASSEPMPAGPMNAGEGSQGMMPQNFQMAYAAMPMQPMMGQPMMQGMPGQPQMVMLPPGAHPMMMPMPIAQLPQQHHHVSQDSLDQAGGK